MICNKRQLSEIIGVTEASLTTWQKDGMPFGSPRGRENQYDTKAVIKWMINRESLKRSGDDIDPVYERARKDKEMADRYELDNKVTRGELLKMEDVEATWTNLVMATRAGVLNIPSKTAQSVAAEPDPAACEVILSDACNEVLEELSRGVS